MPVEVDARGLPCPQPVIRTRSAMREADEVLTLVTGRDQVDNVRRLAERAGWSVAVAEAEGGYAIQMVKGQAETEPEVTPDMLVCAPGEQPRGLKQVLIIDSDRMGQGPDELGGILIKAFIYALSEGDRLPDTMIFFNTGVRLTVKDAPTLEDLRTIADKGVEILVCGTCLDYFGIKDDIRVGSISNMYTIMETILDASRTVSL